MSYSRFLLTSGGYCRLEAGARGGKMLNMAAHIRAHLAAAEPNEHITLGVSAGNERAARDYLHQVLEPDEYLRVDVIGT